MAIRVHARCSMSFYYSNSSMVLLRLHSKLNELGVRFVSLNEEPDLLWLHPEFVTPELLQLGLPVVIEDTNMSVDIYPELREYLLLPNVVSVFKAFKHEDWNSYNIPHVRHCFHVTELVQKFGASQEPPIQQFVALSEAAAQKVSVLYNHAVWPILDECREWPRISKRPYTTHLVQSYKNYWPEILEHRKWSYEKVKGSIGATKACLRGPQDTPWTKRIYRDSLVASLTCVSPWGFDLSSYRDFEAIWAGCILIKPELTTSRIMTWPEVPYKKCKPDFSDLEEILIQCAEGWEFENCQEARESLFEQTKIETLATRVSSLIQQGLRRWT